MLAWLNRHRQDARLADVDCVTLIVQYGFAAYAEACRRQQDAHNAATFAHWGSVAQAVAQRTEQRIGLDTGPGTVTDENVFGRRDAGKAVRGPAGTIDPADELKSIVDEQAADPSPPIRAKVLRLPDHRGRPKDGGSADSGR